MPDRTSPAARICPDCDGFAFVAITLGGRNTAGHLHTITAHCLACRGTGTTRDPRPCPEYDFVGDHEWCRRCGWYYGDHPDYVPADASAGVTA